MAGGEAAASARGDGGEEGPRAGLSGWGPAGGSSSVGLEDFELLRVVGQGAFGKVFQVRQRRTGSVFAMKVLKKERILNRDHVHYLTTERAILTTVIHPYIVKLHYTFQCPTKLYMVMEFVNGGHLFFQLYLQGIFDQAQAQLYAAEIVSAVAHLHELGFAHRDLKPENILLDTEGHVKVTDFGLSKGDVTDEARTNSMCGTIEYMAPEVIRGRGHGRAVDWWAVGILVYEMLVGLPPFRGSNKATVKKRITTEKIKFPKHLTQEAVSLLKGLLQREPAKRLGYGPSGGDEVKRHKFFKGINWRQLERCELSSPFKPTVDGADCVQNFDKEYTGQPVNITPSGTPDEAHRDAFKGFSYTHPSYLDRLKLSPTQEPLGGSPGELGAEDEMAAGELEEGGP